MSAGSCPGFYVSFSKMQSPAYDSMQLKRSYTHAPKVKPGNAQVGPSEMPLLLKMVVSSAVVLMEFSKSVISFTTNIFTAG